MRNYLKKNGKIELDWIEYQNRIFNTDYKPPGVWAPFFKGKTQFP